MLKRYYAEVVHRIGWKGTQGEDAEEESIRPLVGPEDLLSVILCALHLLIFILLVYQRPFEGVEKFHIYLWGLMIPIFLSTIGVFKVGGHSQNKNPRIRYWMTFVQAAWLWLSGLWLGSIVVMAVS